MIYSGFTYRVRLTAHNTISFYLIFRQRKRMLSNKFGSNLGTLTKFCRNSSASGGAFRRKHSLILGIETSCDDTGAAVVDQTGRVWGEALHSQTAVHTQTGGIIPGVARDLHKAHIERVISTALNDAGVTLKDVDAIATTVKPGLAVSLWIGVNYSKELVRESGKPFIPVHHMEAHALTARMMYRVDFPFLVLLASGGHCLLAVARDVDDFLLLGKCLDDSPGDAFDKTARTLKLKNLPECVGLSGGAAVELMARKGDPHAFQLTSVMSHMRNCDFSFAGIKQKFSRISEAQEKIHDIPPDAILPNVSDVCASFQHYVLHHMAQRVQRALLYCDVKTLLPANNRTLVVSGGVASNTFLREGLELLCSQYDCTVVCPPPKLCTDNGIMVAWNGMEKWRKGIGVVNDLDTVEAVAKFPFGTDIREDVFNSSIKLRKIKLM